MMNHIENEIIKGLQKGDRDIFNMVYKSFFNLLCVYAQSFVKSMEIAKEIVQIIFVRLWEHHDRIHIQTSLKAYLYRSTNNACLNYLRDQKRKLESPAEQELLNYLESIVSDDSSWLRDPGQLEFMEHKIRQTIQQLPDQCRQIFILCRFDHLSYPQIADKLSVSLSTVKTQMGRAMAKIRESLNEEN